MSKKLTHEEFMERFYIKNENAENIEILGEYKGSKIKIKCKCRIDGYEWEVTPNDLLNGYGCPKCGGTMKLTHEEFMNRMRDINSDIEILGEYVNNHTKIKVRCKIDGCEWEVKPNDLLKGIGCPKCAGNIKLTHEEFMEKFYKQNKNAENIEVLGKYINHRTKIKCKCRIDGYEWEVTPNNLLNGKTGCPKCNGNIKLTHEEFMERFYIKNDNAENIEILGEYVNNRTKIKCKCKIDEYEWEAIPKNLLKGQGCPKCARNAKKTTEEFKREMKKINENIEILGEYINDSTKIKVRCKIDGCEWEVKPNDLLKGIGCPKCNESKGEKRVAKYLDNKNIEYERQYKFDNCKSKKELPFDFYIPSLNITIEYDGEYHYMIINRGKSDTYERAFNRFVGTKVRDTIKTIYCKENNIKLIRIPYWDFDKIEKILEKELED